MVFRYLMLAIVICLSGCFAHNAEKIEWYPDGTKKSQTRMGEFGLGYWFGMEHYSSKSEPNEFIVEVEGSWARNDPNFVRDLGVAGGNVMGAAVKEVVIP